MKEFNKTQELRKIKFKQNKNTYIKRMSIILSCVILLVGIIMFTFAKFESNKSYTLINGKIGDFTSGDILIAFNLDGTVVKEVQDDYYYTGSECTNNTEYQVTNGDWQNGVIRNLNKKGTKCTLYFTNQINNVPKWLETANINKDYTTIDQVLNDNTTLQALINNNSSCDYLKMSTGWANAITTNENAMTYIGNNNYCAYNIIQNESWSNSIMESSYINKVLQPLVPKMTSNTSPSGKASASSEYSGGYAAWRAFNQNINDCWSTTDFKSATNNWLSYDFEVNSIVKSADINFWNYGYTTSQNYKFQASNDNIEWIDVSDIYTSIDSQHSVFNNNMPYRYYRLLILSQTINNSNATTGRVGTLQFYGRKAN